MEGKPSGLDIFYLKNKGLMGIISASCRAHSTRELEHHVGLVRCGLYDGAEGWRQEDRALHGVESAISGGKAVCSFSDLAPGKYALAVFHAEHGETKIDYGFLGKPKQGVGFSNNPSLRFGPPSFEAASFRVGQEARHLELTSSPA